jgi:hypothetical protein
MVMKPGERWHCANAACRCSVLVETGGEIAGGNPRCACGGAMKKDYSPPVFRCLDLPTFPEPVLASRDSSVE